MFRVDNSTAAAALPTPSPAGTPGYFTGGDLVSGIPATIVEADFLNMLQEELITPITAAGIALSKTNHGQLLAALQLLFASAGQVGYFASTTAPTGFLKCNGAAISRAVYSGLFAAIGTTFGPGDGSTTFNVPDLRGEFLRGLDDGRGVDSGRSLGSSQAGQNLSHHHASPTASSSTAGNYEVAISAGTSVSGTVVGGFATYDYSGGGGAIAYTDYDGGSEARPRNIALLACIRY